MCGKTRHDRIRNDNIRFVVEKMVKTWLRWFGHLEKTPIDSAVKSRSDGE